MYEFIQDAYLIAKDAYPSFIIALVVTSFLIWILRPIAIRLRLLDIPNHRKQHVGSTPLIGGIAMYLGFLFALVQLEDPLTPYRSLVASAGLLVIVGALDDLHELTPKMKFIGQILAILMMVYWGDVRVGWIGQLVPGQNSFLGIWSLPFTIVAAIAVINAVNMSDGVDGLAGSYTLTALLSVLILSIVATAFTVAKILTILIIIIVTFLVFNTKTWWRERAAIFMGDAGSMFLGFMLTWFLISLSQGEDRVMNPVIALWLIALPLFDVVGVTLRRIIRNKPIFSADREHLHHIFELAGYSSSKTLFLLFSFSLLLAAIGIIGYFAGVQDNIMFYAFLILFTIYFSGMLRAWKLMKIIK